MPPRICPWRQHTQRGSAGENSNSAQVRGKTPSSSKDFSQTVQKWAISLAGTWPMRYRWPAYLPALPPKPAGCWERKLSQAWWCHLYAANLPKFIGKGVRKAASRAKPPQRPRSQHQWCYHQTALTRFKTQGSGHYQTTWQGMVFIPKVPSCSVTTCHPRASFFQPSMQPDTHLFWTSILADGAVELQHVSRMPCNGWCLRTIPPSPPPSNIYLHLQPIMIRTVV